MNLIKVDRIVPSFIKYSDKLVILREELWILKKSIVGINLGYDQIDSYNGLYLSIVINLHTEIGPIMIHQFGFVNNSNVPKISNEHIKVLEKYKEQYFPNEIIIDLLTFD